MGHIFLLGENVTSSGELRAGTANGNGGEIELHAQNTTRLMGNSITSVDPYCTPANFYREQNGIMLTEISNTSGSIDMTSKA